MATIKYNTDNIMSDLFNGLLNKRNIPFKVIIAIKIIMVDFLFNIYSFLIII